MSEVKIKINKSEQTTQESIVVRLFAILAKYKHLTFVGVFAFAFLLSGTFLLESKTAFANTQLFSETCGSASNTILSSSTTQTGGTWSAEIALTGANSTQINSNNAATSQCASAATTADVGIAHTISNTPSTSTYYVRASLIDGGTVATTDVMGVLVNYINTSNYYACVYADDAASATLDVYIIKVTGGVGSTLATVSNVSGMATGENVDCRITYSSGTPTIQIVNNTDTAQYAVATDISSPLTETKKAGIFCGATAARTTDDCNTTTRMDNITLFETTADSCSSTGAGGNLGTAASWTSCNGTVPYIEDTITVNSGSPITVAANWGVGGITVGGSATLTISSGVTLTGAGNFTNTGTTTGAGALTLGGAGTTIDGTGSMTGLTGTTTITGNKTINNTANLSLGGALTISGTPTITNNGSITVAGVFTLPTGSTWTQGTDSSLIITGTATISTTSTLNASASGNTVNYAGGAQTARVATYHHLTLSGSGVKTFPTTPTVNGTLSMEGTATITVTTGVVTYGASATLQYNTSTTTTASTEEMVTGSTIPNLIIANTGAITGTASTTVVGTLTVNNGATFRLGNAAFTVNGATVVGTGSTATLNVAAAGSTGTYTFTGAVTVGANGVFDLSTGTHATSFGGGITHNGATFNAGTAAAAFSASQNLAGSSSMTFGGTVTPATSQTVTNNNTGTVTITGTLTLTGNWTQGTNSILALGSNTPTSGAGTLDASTNTNTVQYTGTTVSINTITYSSLILGGTGTYTLPNSGWTINNNLTVTTGATVTKGSGTITFNGSANTVTITGNAINSDLGTISIGNGSAAKVVQLGSSVKLTAVTITSGATLTLNGSNTLTLTGSGTPLTATGTFTASTGTVTYTSGSGISAVSSVAMTGSKKFYNLTIAGTGTFTAGVNIEVDSVFTITSGTYSAGSTTITLNGTGTPMSASGTFTAGTSTVIYTNSTSATAASVTYYNLTFTPSSSTPTYTIPGSAGGSVTWVSYSAFAAGDIVNAYVVDTTRSDVYAGVTPSTGGGKIYKCSLSSIGNCDDSSDWTMVYQATGTNPDIYTFIIDTINDYILAINNGNILIYCDLTTGCDVSGEWTVGADLSGTVPTAVVTDTTNNVMYIGHGNNGDLLRCSFSLGDPCELTGDWAAAIDITTDALVNGGAFDSVNGILFFGSAVSGTVLRCLVSTGCDIAGDWTTYDPTAVQTTGAMTIDTTNNILYMTGGTSGTAGSDGTIFRCALNAGTSSCDDPTDWTTSLSTTESILSTLTFDSEHGRIFAGSNKNGYVYECIISTACDASGDWSISYDSTNTKIQASGYSSAYNYLFAGGDSNNAFRGSVPDGVFVVSNNLTISSNATVVAPSGTMQIGGNFSNSGTFNDNGGTIQFNDNTKTSTISGSNTFNNFTVTTAGKDLVFTAGTTTAINGILTLTGTAGTGNEITLNSTTGSSSWTINTTGLDSSSVSYTTVTWSACTVSSPQIDMTVGTGNANGGNNGTCWYFGSTSITVAGTLYQSDGVTTYTATNPTIKVSVEGGTAASGTVTSGTFSFSTSSIPVAGNTLTMWLDTNGGVQSTLVFKYGTTGGICSTNCSGLTMVLDQVRVQNLHTGNMAPSDLATCDNNSGAGCADADIGFTSDTDLDLTWTTNTLAIVGSTTFATDKNILANNVTVTSGTLTMSTYNLTVGDSGEANSGNIKVAASQTLSQTSGTTTVLSSASGANCIGGNAASCAATAGTITFGNLTVGNASSTFTTTLGDNSSYGPTATIGGVMTVTTNASYTMGVGVTVLSGTGTPLVVNGTFNNGNNGTLRYTGYSAPVTVALPTVTVELKPGGNQTYVLPAGSPRASSLTVGDGTNTITVDADSNDPALYIDYGLTLAANSVWTKSSTTGTINPCGGNSFSPTWTDNNATKQDLGAIVINYSCTLNLGSNLKATSVDITTGDTLDLNTYTLSLTGSGTPLTVSGTFTPDTGTIQYVNTASANVTAATYYNLDFAPASGTPTYTAAAGTLTVSNSLTFSTGTSTLNIDTNDPTVDLNGNINIAIGNTVIGSATGTFTMAGNWSNSGTFTHSNGTVTFDKTTGTQTVDNGSSSFYNVTLNGGGAVQATGNALAIANDLTLSDGTLTTNSQNVTVSGGDVTGNGVVNLTSGTFTLDGNGSFGGSTNWVFNNLTFGNGAGGETSTATGAGTATVSGVLNITTAHTLDGGGKTFKLSGSGTPFTPTGTFTANGSTIEYTSGSGVTALANTALTGSKAFNNLTINGTGTFTAGVAVEVKGDLLASSGTLAMGANNLTVGTTSNTVDYSATDVLGQYDIATGTPLLDTKYINNNPYMYRNGYEGPSAVAVDTVNHRLFVSDYYFNRILVYNLDNSNQLVDRYADYVLGQPDFQTFNSGVDQATVRDVRGLAFDAVNNRLFVHQSNAGRVLVFDVTSITNGENAVNVLGQPNFTSANLTVTQSTLNGGRGIAVNSTGTRLYVANSNANRVLVFDVTSITDGEDAIAVLGQSNYTSSAAATTASGMSFPNGVDLDNSGNRLFVTDTSNHRVLVFDVAAISNGENAVNVLGQSLFTTSSAATTQGGMSSPAGVAYDSELNRLFVSESGNARIGVYDVTAISDGENAVNVLGQSLFTTSSASHTQGGVSSTHSRLAYDTSTNMLYVTDTGYRRVMMYDMTAISDGENAVNVLGKTDWSGNPVYTSGGTFGVENILPGYDSTAGYGLYAPRGVAVDTVDHRIFVADTDNNRILVYTLSSTNKLEDRIPDYVLGQSGFTSRTAATSQSGLSAPAGLVYDATNKLLYVADTSNNRVVVYDMAGNTNGKSAVKVLGQANFTTATANTTQGGLSAPWYLALDSANSRLFVADTSNNRVVVYNVASIADGENAVNVLGQSLFTTSSGATTQGGLSGPKGVLYDSANSRLFVSDTSNNRIIVYDVAAITDGENATAVIGQSDYTTATAGTTQSKLSGPLQLGYNSTAQLLYVPDQTNNRVLIFDVNAISNGENATGVLGQPSYTTSTATTTASGMWRPYVVTYDSTLGKILVAEDVLFAATGNNRVLLFDTSNGGIKVASSGSVTQSSSATALVLAPAGGSTCIGGTGANCTGTNGTISLGALTIGNAATSMTTTVGTGSTVGADTVTITASATLDGGSGTLSITGNGSVWTNNGTFTANASTVAFNSTAATGTTIPAATFYNLTLNRASNTFTAAGAITVNNALTISSGTFVAPGGNLTIKDTITNNGTFTHNSGTVVMTPTNSTKTITVNGSNGITFNGLTNTTAESTIKFKNGNTYTLSGTTTITGAAGSPIWLQSDSGGSQWTVTFSGTINLSYVNVKDAACSGGNTLNANNYLFDQGNNGNCWGFFSRGGGSTNSPIDGGAPGGSGGTTGGGAGGGAGGEGNGSGGSGGTTGGGAGGGAGDGGASP